MRTCSRASLCVRDWGAQPPAWLLLLPTASGDQILADAKVAETQEPASALPPSASRSAKSKSAAMKRSISKRVAVASANALKLSKRIVAAGKRKRRGAPGTLHACVRRRNPDYTPKAVEIAALSVTQILPSARSPPPHSGRAPASP